MDQSVKNAMMAALSQYSKINGDNNKPLTGALTSAFEADNAFMVKVAAMDKAFDDHPRFESLRELVFDLLLINFFNEDVGKLEEDYLESKEWEAIEDQTIDRGTELLNLLLYLKECEDEDIDPELGDFLREFLLVDEDEFQDEHRIYEEVIANQILVDSSLEELARVSDELSENSELKELFYPMIGFFREKNPDDQEFDHFVKFSTNPDFDSAVYSLLLSYNNKHN